MGWVFIIFRHIPGVSNSFFVAEIAFLGCPKALVIMSKGLGSSSGWSSSELLFITIVFFNPSLFVLFNKKAALPLFLSIKNIFFLGLAMAMGIPGKPPPLPKSKMFSPSS